jgi:hypothetical protein
MDKKQRINAFVKCGLFIKKHFNLTEWSENEKALHEGLNYLIETAYTFNGWFTKEFVQESLLNLAEMLDSKSVEKFAGHIQEPAKAKTVAVIMAGNIPLVGFHDLLCVLLSGNKVLIKMSSDDNVLMPYFIKLLAFYEPEISELISFSEGKLSDFDAVIATGSDNSSQYFEYYFGKYPHIIRKNRTSIAVLTGNESQEDLQKLGKDIFLYFGLGCRNVSKLLVPQGYNFDKLFESVFDYKFVVNNKKYGNNYDYNRTVYLLNGEKFLDNNFLIIKEDNGLFSPVSVLFWQEYKDQSGLKAYINENRDLIQCVVGSEANYVPFGYSQQPVITDYADGVNTLEFLVNL